MKKYLLTIALLTFILPQFAHADITSNLLSEYKFDDGSGSTALDSGSLANDGILVNSPTWTSGYIGPGALAFNGTNQSVTIPTSTALANLTNNFSLTAWIYPTTVTGEHRILSRWGSVPSTQQFLCEQSGSNILFAIYSASDGYRVITSTNSVTVNTWNNVACVFDTANNTGYIYINGVQDVTTFTIFSNTVTFSGPMAIAADYGSVSSLFTGNIEDVRIYDRVLTSSDITELYAYREVSVIFTGFKVAVGSVLKAFNNFIIK